MPLRRPQNFAVAFLSQKAGEFVLLSLGLAVTAYFVGRTPEGAGWFPPQPSLAFSLRIGFQTAVLFFLFTLYPLVTLLVVWAYRRLLGVSVPVFSALASFAYVLLWLSIMPGGIGYTHPGFWTVTAIMVAFIWASAVALYPPTQVSAKGRPSSFSVMLIFCAIGFLLIVGWLYALHDLRGWDNADPNNPALIEATLPGRPNFTLEDCLPGAVQPYNQPTLEEYEGTATATVLTCRSRSSALAVILSYLALVGSLLLFLRSRIKRA